MTKNELILDFIRQFRIPGAEKLFGTEMDLYFAHILQSRFGWDGNFVYNRVADHFACEIDGTVYDITGDVSKSGKWEYWPLYSIDATERKEIYNRHIIKPPADARLCATCGHCFDDDWGTSICDRDHSPVDFYGVCNKE